MSHLLKLFVLLLRYKGKHIFSIFKIKCYLF
nr:MAG TPA: hypothetical protein [Caudoviricetes sp.]